MKFKCENSKGKGCTTCGYKKELVKNVDNVYCRVCNRQDYDLCPISNSKAPLSNCNFCSWMGNQEWNIKSQEQKMKDNLKAKKEAKLLEDKPKKSYNNKGLYNGYDKNNKERDSLDYYATPSQEVENILEEMGLIFRDSDIILENSCGGGHMVDGIINYLKKNRYNPYIVATDVQDRKFKLTNKYDRLQYNAGLTYDYLKDDYPSMKADYVIMNPPFNVAEGFIIRALNETKKGVLCLARLQLLETISRYNNIFRKYPPSLIYVYVDRIYCPKNGDFSLKEQSAQAYAWFYWDIKLRDEPKIRWIWAKKG